MNIWLIVLLIVFPVFTYIAGVVFGHNYYVSKALNEMYVGDVVMHTDPESNDFLTIELQQPIGTLSKGNFVVMYVKEE